MIKNIEDLTIEECQHYLETQSNEKVRARLNQLLQEKEEEQRLHQQHIVEEQHREQEEFVTQQRRRETYVEWMDFAQFKDIRKYRKFNMPLILGMILLAVVLIILYTIIINYSYNDNWSIMPAVAFFFLFIPAAILLILSIFYHSPSLSSIYNIERSEPVKGLAEYRRVQNKAGKLGLALCRRYNIKLALSMIYTNIYPIVTYGSEAYVCEYGGKKGVYNVLMRKMVIPVENDRITIVSVDRLLVEKDNLTTVFTPQGYRVLE